MQRPLIVLNGVSSVGNTADGPDLPNSSTDAWMVLGIDLRGTSIPEQLGSDLRRTQIHSVGQYDFGGENLRVEAAWLRRAATVASSGVGVTLDEAFLEGGAAQMGRRIAIEGLDGMWIGILCDMIATSRRVRACEDRTIGPAAAPFALVHDGVSFDLTTDTTTTDPLSVAIEIRLAINQLAEDTSPI